MDAVTHGRPEAGQSEGGDSDGGCEDIRMLQHWRKPRIMPLCHYLYLSQGPELPEGPERCPVRPPTHREGTTAGCSLQRNTVPPGSLLPLPCSPVLLLLF